MNKDKKSFFERLTGTINVAADEDMEESVPVHKSAGNPKKAQAKDDWMEETETVGELAVDVYQTPENIFIKTMVAGVKPEDLDVSISRDMVTVSGRREEARTTSDDDYFLKELYWGEFSRTILLPSEIEPENAEAYEKHGLLIIRLPKVNKDRQTKLRVKSS
jgi:HSP20 family protein